MTPKFKTENCVEISKTSYHKSDVIVNANNHWQIHNVSYIGGSKWRINAVNRTNGNCVTFSISTSYMNKLFKIKDNLPQNNK